MRNLHSKLLLLLEICFSYVKSVHSLSNVWRKVVNVTMEEYCYDKTCQPALALGCACMVSVS